MSATTWDPLKSGTNSSLSGGSLTATVWNIASVLGTNSRTDVPRYFEVHYDANLGPPQVAIIGVATDSINLNNYLGHDSAGIGYYEQDGTLQYNAGSIAYGSAYTTGDVIGVAYNPATGAIEWFKNNASQGVHTNAAFIGAAFFPAIGAGSTSPSTFTTTLRCTTGSFSYSPPGYAQPWDDSAASNFFAVL